MASIQSHAQKNHPNVQDSVIPDRTRLSYADTFIKHKGLIKNLKDIIEEWGDTAYIIGYCMEKIHS